MKNYEKDVHNSWKKINEKKIRIIKFLMKFLSDKTILLFLFVTSPVLCERVM
jgi:hypothetical protein